MASKNETKVKSSEFEDLRLLKEGDALLMQGPHHSAPTYSPNTLCPGLVANNCVSNCVYYSQIFTVFSDNNIPAVDIVNIIQIINIPEKET